MRDFISGKFLKARVRPKFLQHVKRRDDFLTSEVMCLEITLVKQKIFPYDFVNFPSTNCM